MTKGLRLINLWVTSRISEMTTSSSSRYLANLDRSACSWSLKGTYARSRGLGTVIDSFIVCYLSVPRLSQSDICGSLPASHITTRERPKIGDRESRLRQNCREGRTNIERPWNCCYCRRDNSVTSIDGLSPQARGVCMHGLARFS
jgi:hypothetical protein